MGFEIEKRNSEEGTDRGTVVVELAMMLPFLIILLLGIMELSIIVHNKSVITNASREELVTALQRWGDSNRMATSSKGSTPS